MGMPSNEEAAGQFDVLVSRAMHISKNSPLLITREPEEYKGLGLPSQAFLEALMAAKPERATVEKTAKDFRTARMDIAKQQQLGIVDTNIVRSMPSPEIAKYFDDALELAVVTEDFLTRFPNVRLADLVPTKETVFGTRTTMPAAPIAAPTAVASSPRQALFDPRDDVFRDQFQSLLDLSSSDYGRRLRISSVPQDRELIGDGVDFVLGAAHDYLRDLENDADEIRNHVLDRTTHYRETVARPTMLDRRELDPHKVCDLVDRFTKTLYDRIAGEHPASDELKRVFGVSVALEPEKPKVISILQRPNDPR